MRIVREAGERVEPWWGARPGPDAGCSRSTCPTCRSATWTAASRSRMGISRSPARVDFKPGRPAGARIASEIGPHPFSASRRRRHNDPTPAISSRRRRGPHSAGPDFEASSPPADPRDCAGSGARRVRGDPSLVASALAVRRSRTSRCSRGAARGDRRPGPGGGVPLRRRGVGQISQRLRRRAHRGVLPPRDATRGRDPDADRSVARRLGSPPPAPGTMSPRNPAAMAFAAAKTATPGAVAHGVAAHASFPLLKALPDRTR